MKAISLWQPWASLVSTGAKRIETRGWPTTYRGPLAICAAKRIVKQDMLFLLSQWGFQFGLAPLIGKDFNYAGWPGVSLNDMPYGKAVAIAVLAGCLPVEKITIGELESKSCAKFNESLFGDYSNGRYGWILEDIKRIKNPFPVIGRQGFFEVDVPERIELIPV